jgi:hypothetical protein
MLFIFAVIFANVQMLVFAIFVAFILGVCCAARATPKARPIKNN